MSDAVNPGCEPIREIILARLAGDVPDELSLERHLKDCAVCRAYERDMALLTGSIKTLSDEPLPDGLNDRIMARVAEVATASDKPAPRIPIRRFAPVAAAVLVLALTLPVMLKPTPQAGTTSQPLASVPQQAEAPAKVRAPQAAQPQEQAGEPAHTEALAEVQQPEPREVAVANTATAKLQPVRATAQPMASTAQPIQPALPEPESLLAVALAPMEFAADAEGDLYYDPLSEWVGF